MEIKGMNTEEQATVNKLFDIMKDQGMKEASNNMEDVLRYIVGMQVQLAMVTNELHGIKEQLNQMQNPQPAAVKIKDNVTKSVQQFEGKITQLSTRVADAKTHFIDTASKAVNAFKDKGKQAMNAVLQKGISGMKKRITGCREHLTDVVNSYESTAARIDSVGNELKQAGNSFANIGRILSGKEPKAAEISEEKPGVALTRMINKPIKQAVSEKKGAIVQMDAALTKLDKISGSLNASLGAAKKAEKTDQEEKEGDKEANGKENRESIKDKLSQMKEKSEQQKEQTEPQKEKKQEACL